MLKRRIASWFTKRPAKPFRAWQIELTTSCSLACRMCVREAKVPWQDRQMPLADFRKLLPALSRVETVVLEGWGESLLHPDLVEIIGLVKAQGPKVGFVTSGMGLDRERAAAVVAAGVDFIGFSLAGVTAATHEAIRRHSRFPELLAGIRLVREAGCGQGGATPRLHIVYLLLKDNIAEVPLLPALAREAGVGEIVLINPCHIATAWLEAQQPFSLSGQTLGYEPLLTQAEARAREMGIRLTKPALVAAETALCSEDPLANLYVSVEGEVAPCVYSHPPLPSPLTRRFRGQTIAVEKISFGNLFCQPFDEIWEGAAYRAFRDSFRERQRAFRAFSLSLIDGRVKDPRLGLVWPEPPVPCRSCHKLLGL